MKVSPWMVWGAGAGGIVGIVIFYGFPWWGPGAAIESTMLDQFGAREAILVRPDRPPPQEPIVFEADLQEPSWGSGYQVMPRFAASFDGKAAGDRHRTFVNVSFRMFLGDESVAAVQWGGCCTEISGTIGPPDFRDVPADGRVRVVMTFVGFSAQGNWSVLVQPLALVQHTRGVDADWDGWLQSAQMVSWLPSYVGVAGAAGLGWLASLGARRYWIRRNPPADNSSRGPDEVLAPEPRR